MQFTQFPYLTIIRPKPTLITSSLTQMICFALQTDFKKYSWMSIQSMTMNNLEIKGKQSSEQVESSTSSQSKQSLQSVDTVVNQQKSLEKDRKTNSSFQNESEINQSNKKIEIKRSQTLSSFKNSAFKHVELFDHSKSLENSISQNIDNSNHEDKQQSSQSQQLKSNKKNKKIVKSKKIFTRLQKKIIKNVITIEPQFQISTNVSLIETIDLPKIGLSRLDIERKKQNLWARLFQQQPIQTKRNQQMTRQKRELKRLN